MKTLILALALATLPLAYASDAPALTSESSPRIESAFSPDAGGEALVLKVIASANNQIRLAAYAMHHDKYIVADERTVQNGSFNYTLTAANLNSENVIVHWQHPDLAQAFLQHGEDRWGKGVDYPHPQSD